MTDSYRIYEKARRLVKHCGTSDPVRIAKESGIMVRDVPDLTGLLGMYVYRWKHRIILMNPNVSSTLYKMVLAHEIGHDQLHRKEAELFQEFNLFDMAANQLEYEANLFAAQIALPDEDILEYVHQGYTDAQIAQITRSDINLVALKISELARRGYELRVPEHKRNFLE